MYDVNLNQKEDKNKNNIEIVELMQGHPYPGRWSFFSTKCLVVHGRTFLSKSKREKRRWCHQHLSNPRIPCFQREMRKNHKSAQVRCFPQHVCCFGLRFLQIRGWMLEKVLWELESIQLKDFQVRSKNKGFRCASHSSLSISDDLEAIAAFVLSCYIYYQSGLREIQFKLHTAAFLFSVDILMAISKPFPKKCHLFVYTFMPKLSSRIFPAFKNANPLKSQKEAIVHSVTLEDQRHSII